MGIKGNLEDVSVPDVFQLISIGSKSGKLIVRGQRGKASITFDKGRIIQASIENYKRNIGNLLVEQGFLSEDSLLEAIETQKNLPQWRQLGAICTEKGFVTKEQLEEAVKSLITEIVTEIIAWKEGFFTFDTGNAKIEDDISLDMRELIFRSGLSSDVILIEGAKRLDEKREEKQRGTIEKSDLFFDDSGRDNEKKPVSSSGMAGIEEQLLGDLDLSFMDGLLDDKAAPAGSSDYSVQKGIGRIYHEVKTLKETLLTAQEESVLQEFTLSLLKFASEAIGRVLLFVLKEGYACGSGHMGFASGQVSIDEEVRGLKIPLDKPSFIRTVCESKETYRGELEENPWNGYLTGKIGGFVGLDVVAFPVIINGEVKFVLYADNYNSKRSLSGTEELESFLYQAGMALEIALLERNLKKGT